MQRTLAENFVISHKSKGHYCFFCGFYFDEAVDHINNPAHQFNKELPDKKSIIVENNLISRPTYYHCIWCNAKLATFQIAKQHVQGKRHNQLKNPSAYGAGQPHFAPRVKSKTNPGDLVESERVATLAANQNTNGSSHLISQNRNANEATWNGPGCKPVKTITRPFQHNHTSNSQKKIESRDQPHAATNHRVPQSSASVGEVKPNNFGVGKKKYLPPFKIQSRSQLGKSVSGVGKSEIHSSKVDDKNGSNDQSHIHNNYSGPQSSTDDGQVKMSDVKVGKKKYLPPFKIQNKNQLSKSVNEIGKSQTNPLKVDAGSNPSTSNVTPNQSVDKTIKSLVHETKKLSVDNQRASSSKQLGSDCSGSDSDGEENSPFMSRALHGTGERELEPIMLDFHFQYYFDNLRHLKKNIRKVRYRTYRCGPCERDFDGIIDAFHHSNQKSHKLELKKNPGPEHYFCTLCQIYLTKDETLLQCHLLYHLRRNFSTREYDIVSLEFNAKKKPKIQCLLCGAVKNDRVLAEHIKSADHKRKLNILVQPREPTPAPEINEESDSNINLTPNSYYPNRDVCIKSFCYTCFKPKGFNPGSNMQVIKEKRSKKQLGQSNLHEQTHCIKDVDDETNFFRCFLCELPFKTFNLLKEHYAEPHHKVRLQTLLANLDEYDENSDGSNSSWASMDDDCSDTQVESTQENGLGKTAKDGECSNQLDKGSKKPTSVKKLRDERNSLKPRRIKGFRGKSGTSFPHNDDLLRFGSNHVAKCLEPGEDNIYNAVTDTIPVLEKGIDLIYPSKTVYVCLVCDYSIPAQLQHLMEHLHHEVHKENLRSLIEDCKTMTEDKFTYLDLAEHCLKEKDGKLIDCLACGFAVEDSDDVIETHIKSQQHIVKLQHWKISTEALKSQVSDIIKDSWYFAQKYFCQVCQCIVNKEAVFAHHLTEPGHLRLVDASKKENKINICHVCSLCWYGTTNHGDHFNDEQHKRTMRSKRRGSMLPKMDYDSRLLLASAEKKVEKLMKESDTVIQSQKAKEVALLQAIEETVKPKYPLAKAYMFGSRISYSCSTNSDADVFLDCENIYHEVGSKRKSQNYIKALRSLFAPKNRPQSQDNWTKVIALTSPRVPIIRLKHVHTGLNCDISFLNGLSTEKSKLIRNYIVADERCRKLILFLKKWFNACDLYGPRAINCYALSWYVIFFMQVKGIFPSVDQVNIRDGAMIIDGWYCNYMEKVPTEASNATFKDLLMEFFMYYAKFDYQTSVVCPLAGKVIKKSLFVNFDDLPAEMETYKNRMKTEEMEIFRFDSPMCIQDPVDLTQNITKAVSKLQLKTFRIYCLESHTELSKQE